MVRVDTHCDQSGTHLDYYEYIVIIQIASCINLNIYCLDIFSTIEIGVNVMTADGVIILIKKVPLSSKALLNKVSLVMCNGEFYPFIRKMYVDTFTHFRYASTNH